MSVPFQLVDHPGQLASLDEVMHSAPWIAFDTEFVSEYSYLPQLCLVQIAVPETRVLIDAVAISDLRPVWEWLLESDRPVIVHAGREELLFCLRATGQIPPGWFDVQLAAGFATTVYPASYGKLVERFCGRTLPKGETRTDWRQRPLTRRQQEYACQDVIYLAQIYQRLMDELTTRQRLSWLQDEMASWQEKTAATLQGESWHRLPSIHRLTPRQLAIAREVWRWRESEAAHRNIFPRRVLRDDLIVELARRESDNPQRIRAVRGMEWRKVSRSVDAIVDAIRRGLETPADQCPELPRGGPPTTIGNLLPQFLNTALHSLCVAESIAPTLVATMQDVRDFSEFHLSPAAWRHRPPPKLTQGWRKELIGNTLNRLLSGELAIRIENPKSDHPLILEERPRDDEGPQKREHPVE